MIVFIFSTHADTYQEFIYQLPVYQIQKHSSNVKHREPVSVSIETAFEQHSSK